MNIDQPILKMDMNSIIKLIENIIINKLNGININFFFPKKKEFFDKFIDNIKKLCEKNSNLYETLECYKGYGYRIINQILINEKFPLILEYNDYNHKSNKTKFDTRSIYIFPDNVENIKKYHTKQILDHIKNLDSIFINNFCKLSDCILFRGMKKDIPQNDLNNKDDYNIFKKLTYISNNKSIFNNDNNSKEVLFKNYLSFSINPLIASSFAKPYLKNQKGFYLILNIKKEHNIPGFFLSDKFFKHIKKNITYNSIENDEMEILISRNLKIKILKIKKFKLNSEEENFRKSIKNIYSNEKHNKYIKIIFAESMPFEYPPQFNIEGYKYLCL